MLEKSLYQYFYQYSLIKHRMYVQYLSCGFQSLLIFLSLTCFAFRSFAAVGVEPGVMGIGPAVAIPAAVKSAGLELKDIDLFEINEVFGWLNNNSSSTRSNFKIIWLPLNIQAFASQFVYCCKKLDLDKEKVNVNGGAIALGHPLGATGNTLLQH